MKKKKEKKTVLSRSKPKEPMRRSEETHDLLTDPSHLQRFAAAAEASGGKKDNLGDRIRRAREMRSLTFSDLSSRTGISVEKLERIESNELIPPLGELIKLGKAVEMKMGDFISPGVKKPAGGFASHRPPTTRPCRGPPCRQSCYFYESLA